MGFHHQKQSSVQTLHRHTHTHTHTNKKHTHIHYLCGCNSETIGFQFFRLDRRPSGGSSVRARLLGVRVLRRGTTYKEVARCVRNVTRVSRANLDTQVFCRQNIAISEW